MVLHAHQPPGNFDAAFQRATDECYRPFIEVLERFPGVRVSLHCSGSLLEWLEAHEPALIEAIQRLVERGQIEPVSAGLYEPILALLPERDRVGQLLGHRAYMRRLFGVEPTVGWLTERVWTQALASDLAAAEIDAIPLDDLHFLGAGLEASRLDRPYLTEHQGHTLTVVPAPKEMRDALPWEPVERAIEAIQRHAQAGDAMLVYADDLEKWGLWPGTYQTVYERGWLERFFAALERLAERNDLDVVPLGEALLHVRPQERVYLPDGSYAEMMQWTLPPARQRAEAALREHLREAGLWDEAMPFMRAGTYMQFLRKYPEVNHLHKRMLDISARVGTRHTLRSIRRHLDRDEALPESVRSLWRAQANCAYWHGMFGGTYLPFLRQSLFHNLLLGERALEREGEVRRAMRVADLDSDGEQELIATTSALTVVVASGDGGSIVELSDRERACNLADTLARREEAYHSAEQPPYPYDRGRRGMFVDRFLAAGRTPPRSRSVEDLGEFAGARYTLRSRRAGGATTAHLDREGAVPGGIVRVEKTIRLDDADPRALHVEYLLTCTEGDLDARFGVEVNFAMLFGAARIDGDPIDLGKVTAVTDASEVALDGWDETLGAELRTSAPCDLDVRPITTVSQSEAGTESIRQSTACLCSWPLRLHAGDTFTAAFTLRIGQRGGS